jgi:hypothetical protein
MTNRQCFYLVLTKIFFRQFMDDTMFSKGLVRLLITSLHNFPLFTTVQLDLLKVCIFNEANKLL